MVNFPLQLLQNTDYIPQAVHYTLSLSYTQSLYPSTPHFYTPPQQVTTNFYLYLWVCFFYVISHIKN